MAIAGKAGDEERGKGRGLPPSPISVSLARAAGRLDWKRIACLGLGIFLFGLVYFWPAWPDAVDASGRHFALTREGKAALALFLLAATWWMFEATPAGVTGAAVAVIQVLFAIRPAQTAFRDFMDPAIWLIFACYVFGLAFNKTGLAKRLAYKMLTLAGERTSMIYLAGMAMTAALSLIMAHTSAVAAVFPLLMAIYSLNEDGDQPTRFGKGLFMGMAWAAGAGSIITMFGSARAAAAVGWFKEFSGGREIGFFEVIKYMFPLGAVLAVLLWLYILVVFRPERKEIPGLRDRARALYAKLGPISRKEILSLGLFGAAIAFLGLGLFIPAWKADKSAVILAGALGLFLVRALELKDLEEMPWNMILLYGGTMSLGYCLWQTQADQWLAAQALARFHFDSPLVLLLAAAGLALLMTNFIMNVAVIALLLPVALVIASSLGAAPEPALFSLLAAAGMPFLLLIGAAPNAIAFGSGQFTAGEFFRAGIIPSLLVMAALWAFIAYVWPAMGMPILQ